MLWRSLMISPNNSYQELIFRFCVRGKLYQLVSPFFPIVCVRLLARFSLFVCNVARFLPYLYILFPFGTVYWLRMVNGILLARKSRRSRFGRKLIALSSVFCTWYLFNKSLNTKMLLFPLLHPLCYLNSLFECR